MTTAEIASGLNALAMAGGLAAAIVFLTRFWDAWRLPIAELERLHLPAAQIKRLRYYFFWWGVAAFCLFCAGAAGQPYYVVRARLPSEELRAWLDAMPAELQATPSRQFTLLVAMAMGGGGLAGLMKLRGLAELIAGRWWLAPIIALQVAVFTAFALLPRLW